MLVDDIDRIVDESANKLLQSASPSVRFWTLKDIMRKDREDLAVQRVLEQCEVYPPRLQILRNLGPDGTWPVQRPRKTDGPMGPDGHDYATHTTMLRNLLKLLHFVTPPCDARVERSTEKLLSWQTRDGYITGPAAHGFPQPHYNGYALYLLVGFVKEEDPRHRRIAEWLMSMQRKDGGWNMPYIQDVRYLQEYNDLGIDEFIALMQTEERDRHDPRVLRDVPSCHWTTMMVLWGLNEFEWARRSRCVERATELLMTRFYKRNPHNNYYESEKNWTKVKYPHDKCSGLAVLDVLTKAGRGPDDPRMEKPIRWLMSSRYRDGFWTESDRPHTETGQWITLLALWVLSQYAMKL